VATLTVTHSIALRDYAGKEIIKTLTNSESYTTPNRWLITEVEVADATTDGLLDLGDVTLVARMAIMPDKDISIKIGSAASTAIIIPANTCLYVAAAAEDEWYVTNASGDAANVRIIAVE